MQEASAFFEGLQFNEAINPKSFPLSSSSSSSSFSLLPKPSSTSVNLTKVLHQANEIVEKTQKHVVKNEMWKYLDLQQLFPADELEANFINNMQSGALTHTVLYANPGHTISFEVEPLQPKIEEKLPAKPKQKKPTSQQKHEDSEKESSLQQKLQDSEKEIQTLKAKLAAAEKTAEANANFHEYTTKSNQHLFNTTVANLVKQKEQSEKSRTSALLRTQHRINELQATLQKAEQEKLQSQQEATQANTEKTRAEEEKTIALQQAQEAKNAYLMAKENEQIAIFFQNRAQLKLQDAEQEKVKIEISSNRRIIDFIVNQKIIEIEKKIQKLKTDYNQSKTALIDIEDPEEILCPISTSLIKDPVAVVGSTKIYDRSSIEQWFSLNNNTCPSSRITLSTASHKELLALPALKRAIEAYQRCKQEVSVDPSSSSSLCSSSNPGKTEVEHLIGPKSVELNAPKSEKKEEKDKAESKTNTSSFEAGFFGAHAHQYAKNEAEFSAQTALAIERSRAPEPNSNENVFSSSLNSSSSSSSS